MSRYAEPEDATAFDADAALVAALSRGLDSQENLQTLQSMAKSSTSALSSSERSPSAYASADSLGKMLSAALPAPGGASAYAGPEDFAEPAPASSYASPADLERSVSVLREEASSLLSALARMSSSGAPDFAIAAACGTREAATQAISGGKAGAAAAPPASAAASPSAGPTVPAPESKHQGVSQAAAAGPDSGSDSVHDVNAARDWLLGALRSQAQPPPPEFVWVRRFFEVRPPGVPAPTRVPVSPYPFPHSPAPCTLSPRTDHARPVRRAPSRGFHGPG